MNLPIANKVLITALVLVLISGCSAQKNTGLSRTFHNLTARYNVLFNGRESFKKGLVNIEKGYRDDYSEILPVFIFLEKDAITLAGPDMDRTIKKCSKLISLHSITAKPKVKSSRNLSQKQREFFNKREYNLLIDDAYLLMAKAHFCRQEYVQANEIFRLILNDFKTSPIIYETQIWLARLLIETGTFKDAYEILNLLANNPDFPKQLLSELFSTFAVYHLEQKDYIQAISYLEKTLGTESRKKPVTRYMYILAQLFEKTGDLKRASDYYARVIKMNPVYDMAFNARISRALAYQQGFGKAEDIAGELDKMLHDDKNNEYQDQIYYALGDLAAKAGNNKMAFENYKKSIEVNVINDLQKTRSYLTIANLYYSIPDYPHAQAYYDSTLTNVDPDYPGYDALYTKTRSLTRLVKDINTLQLEDSLLMLSRLPKEEVNRRVDAIIAGEREKEELERQRQQEEQLDQQYGNEVAVRNFTRQQTAGEGASWYFYNDAAKSLGYREFKLKFGNRKLEDHWQRLAKTAVSFANGDQEEISPEAEVAGSPEISLSKMSREYYLVNIPTTDSAIEVSNRRIEQALYNMGEVYKNELNDLDKASASYKELIRRYPQSEYLLPAYFNLYAIARDQNNTAMADYYKNIVIGQFPGSINARVLNNPNYAKELEEGERRIQDYYKDTYEHYKAGNFGEVIIRSDHALKNYSGNPLIPSFAYLSALSKGINTDRKTFRDDLVTFMAKYPGTEASTEAQLIIRFIDNERPEFREAEEKILSEKLYQKDFENEHYFAYIVNKKINTNQLVFNIINFNLDLFDNQNLRVEITDINTAENLVMVKSFRDKQEVLQYLEVIATSGQIEKDMPEITMVPIAISVVNLITLKEDKSTGRYLKFYAENYR
ncbi:MAG TPA: tetratricopeptide repeat protein [Bacteroidales bacterium]|nr:tetratricopeptide repeat protein [Bacteroidales bacterium]